jgi:hypothetical protein
MVDKITFAPTAGDAVRRQILATHFERVLRRLRPASAPERVPG